MRIRITPEKAIKIIKWMFLVATWITLISLFITLGWFLHKWYLGNRQKNVSFEYEIETPRVKEVDL